MALTVNTSTLLNPLSKEAYTATASIKDGTVDSTTGLTGDRTSGLFDPKKQQMGKDSFLKLLVTQMRFQDPMNPADNTAMVAQLAQFQSLESNLNIEKAIAKLDDSYKSTVAAQQSSAQSLTNSAAISMIGKEVRLKTSQVTYYGKAIEMEPIRINLGSAQSASVQIVDKDGTVVRTLETGTKDATNASTIGWNGAKDNGQLADVGTYTVTVVGGDKNPSLYAFVQDTVQGVRFDGGSVKVKIGGQELPVEQILDVSATGSTAQLSSLSPTSAVALLGKDVRIKQDGVTFGAQDNEMQTIRINMGGAHNATVSLRDSMGRTVATLSAEADADGTATISWDGRNADGNAFVAAGKYSIYIAGQEANQSLYAFTQGRVDGINNLSGATQVRVNGVPVSLDRIVDIYSAATGDTV